MITTEKIIKWRTSDGAEHSSKEMADQHVLNAEICQNISERLYLRGDVDPQDIVNWMTSNAKQIREFLDACEAMERASLR